MNKEDVEIQCMLNGITGGATSERIEKFKYAMNHFKLPVNAFDIMECGDEKTGNRFGNANCRRGWAYKLGGDGRNKGSRYAYQVWAVVRSEYRNEFIKEKEFSM